MQDITVAVTLDSKTFRKFAIYDTLFRTKRLGKILVFTAIMLFFAVLSFLIGGGSASTLTATLAGVGLFLPILYLGTFLRSIRYQIERNGLRKGRYLYTLHFTNATDGIEVTDESGQKVRYEWDKLYGAYRHANCTYLYIVKSQAFLLPDACVEVGADNLWAFFKQQLPAQKLHNKKK